MQIFVVLSVILLWDSKFVKKSSRESKKYIGFGCLCNHKRVISNDFNVSKIRYN